ncbi:MAG: hypothetical protein II877_03620 [Synergistaceae bacterium]|nr:hypothetical protein [Synergistaceae bacterium]
MGAVKPETLAQFGQVVFELHDITNPASHERVLNALRKINMTHQLVHLHVNNYMPYVSSGGKIFANVLEASYILREGHNFCAGYDMSLPLGIDMPNAKSLPEIELGRWNVKAEIDGRFVMKSVI